MEGAGADTAAGPATQGAPPPQNGPTEPDVCVSDANAGQLGHESRLKLMAIIAVAKSIGLFPSNPKMVDALPGREVPIPLVDESVIPVRHPPPGRGQRPRGTLAR